VTTNSLPPTRRLSTGGVSFAELALAHPFQRSQSQQSMSSEPTAIRICTWLSQLLDESVVGIPIPHAPNVTKIIEEAKQEIQLLRVLIARNCDQDEEEWDYREDKIQASIAQLVSTFCHSLLTICRHCLFIVLHKFRRI
jgi:hypothetical protein